ncbi:hypothetical protein KVG88_30010 [Pseudomonas sp. SWRI74]|uniref:Uncharacterized protein n=1 Tax=Pseudomonas azerbaijanoccidentalis TaxID=2842347 RepID=A0ABS6QZF6_9PSED|nr:hypothetical protein [Pseudomonas azerbaijanoccidentalis]MBV4524310.1 hypothetical protein [Pseudomonas azerbaijanoccidentalis]
MNMLRDVLKNSNAVATAVQKANEGNNAPDNKGNMLDNANENNNDAVPEIVFTEDMRLDATRVIAEWAQTDDLGDDEGYGDRLLALIVGTAAHSDNDLTEDEVEYAGMVAEVVGDYLSDKGIPDDDLDALFNDGKFDNDVAERVHEALLDKLPDGEDAMMDDAGRFVDGEDDATMLDATYRKKIVVRGGKKVRINKRIAGTVRLTAAQKSAVRKMQRKAFSGTAKIKRAKSMRLRKKMSL